MRAEERVFCRTFVTIFLATRRRGCIRIEVLGMVVATRCNTFAPSVCDRAPAEDKLMFPSPILLAATLMPVMPFPINSELASLAVYFVQHLHCP